MGNHAVLLPLASACNSFCRAMIACFSFLLFSLRFSAAFLLGPPKLCGTLDGGNFLHFQRWHEVQRHFSILFRWLFRLASLQKKEKTNVSSFCHFPFFLIRRWLNRHHLK